VTGGSTLDQKSIMRKKIEEQLFRSGSASVGEAVSGSRGKSQAGLLADRRSMRWFDPQECAGLGKYVQQSVWTLTHVADPLGTAGDELYDLLVRDAAVP
jgi:hypothetical protein